MVGMVGRKAKVVEVFFKSFHVVVGGRRRRLLFVLFRDSLGVLHRELAWRNPKASNKLEVTGSSAALNSCNFEETARRRSLHLGLRAVPQHSRLMSDRMSRATSPTWQPDFSMSWRTVLTSQSSRAWQSFEAMMKSWLQSMAFARMSSLGSHFPRNRNLIVDGDTPGILTKCFPAISCLLCLQFTPVSPYPPRVAPTSCYKPVYQTSSPAPRLPPPSISGHRLGAPARPSSIEPLSGSRTPSVTPTVPSFQTAERGRRGCRDCSTADRRRRRFHCSRAGPSTDSGGPSIYSEGPSTYSGGPFT